MLPMVRKNMSRNRTSIKKPLSQSTHQVSNQLDRTVVIRGSIIKGLPTDPMNELLADLGERGEMT